MKNHLPQTAIALLAGIGMASCLLPQITLAQVGTAQPYDQSQGGNRDPYSGANTSESSFSVFDMIHRANLGGPGNMRQYIGEQNQSIINGGSKFRRRQLERLQNQNPATPANPQNPVTTTSPITTPPASN